MAPNQVHQLAGNVWERTEGDFAVTDDRGGLIVGDMRAFPIRGGAFITHIALRMFPAKTLMEADQWHWAHYQVRRRIERSPWTDPAMPDIAGESLSIAIAAIYCPVSRPEVISTSEEGGTGFR